MEFCTVLKKNFGAYFWLHFFALSKLLGLLFESFWCRKLAKRGPAGSLCSSVIFQVAGPLFGDPAAQVWQKGVPQPVRLEFHDPAFHFLAPGPLFVLPGFWILQKGVQRHLISDFYLFPGAGPLFEL